MNVIIRHCSSKFPRSRCLITAVLNVVALASGRELRDSSLIDCILEHDEYAAATDLQQYRESSLSTPPRRGGFLWLCFFEWFLRNIQNICTIEQWHSQSLIYRDIYDFSPYLEHESVDHFSGTASH
jgi:hypothetical protein